MNFQHVFMCTIVLDLLCWKKGFQRIKKMICKTAWSYISIFFFFIVEFTREQRRFAQHCTGGVGGTAAIAVTVVRTESQPRLVTASRNQPFYGSACPCLPLWLPSNILVYMHSDKHTQNTCTPKSSLCNSGETSVSLSEQKKKKRKCHLKTVFVRFSVFWLLE